MAGQVVSKPLKGRDATREKLIQTAYLEFLQKGYLNTTIKGVCARAGYTRGAFYSNFRSKEDLFETIYFRANRQQIGQIQQAIHDAIDIFLKNKTSTSADVASIICAALRTLEYGTGYEVEWFGMVTELRGASIRDQASRKILIRAQDDLYNQLESLLKFVLDQTGSRLALPVRDVVVLGVGLYERALSSSPLSEEPHTVKAVDSLERLLRAVTISTSVGNEH